MAQYNEYDHAQTNPPGNSEGQILRGTYDCPVSERIDAKLDLRVFVGRHNNGATGAPAPDSGAVPRTFYSLNSPFESAGQV